MSAQEWEDGARRRRALDAEIRRHNAEWLTPEAKLTRRLREEDRILGRIIRRHFADGLDLNIGPDGWAVISICQPLAPDEIEVLRRLAVSQEED